MLYLLGLGGALRAILRAGLLPGAVLLMAAGAPQARSPDRAVILLSCPDESQAPALLCQAMIQALAHTVPGPKVLRRVPRGQETPTRPGDIGLALHATQEGTKSLAGHLEWRLGADGGRQTGPDHRMTVAPAVFSPKTYDEFAHALLKATPDLRAALTARP